MIFFVKMGISLFKSLLLHYLDYVEYYDCALLGGFTYVFMRAIFDAPIWLAAGVAAVMLGLFFYLYKKKYGYWGLVLGFSGLWGYILSKLSADAFKLDITWFYILCGVFALFAFFGHSPLHIKRQARAEAKAEFYGYKLPKSPEELAAEQRAQEQSLKNIQRYSEILMADAAKAKK